MNSYIEDTGVVIRTSVGVHQKHPANINVCVKSPVLQSDCNQLLGETVSLLVHSEVTSRCQSSATGLLASNNHTQFVLTADLISPVQYV